MKVFITGADGSNLSTDDSKMIPHNDNMVIFCKTDGYLYRPGNNYLIKLGDLYPETISTTDGPEYIYEMENNELLVGDTGFYIIGKADWLECMGVANEAVIAGNNTRPATIGDVIDDLSSLKVGSTYSLDKDGSLTKEARPINVYTAITDEKAICKATEINPSFIFEEL